MSSLSPYDRPHRFYSPYTSPFLEYLQAESRINRQRLAAQVEASRLEIEEAIRQSRRESELADSRRASERALRSSLEMDAKIQKIEKEINLRDSLRKLRVDHEVDSMLRRY